MTKSARPKQPTSAVAASKRLDLLQARVDTLAAGLKDLHQTDLREVHAELVALSDVATRLLLRVGALEEQVARENP